MSKPVFISHAVADHDLADRLVDLLETGVGIPDSDIFCSSLQGMGIPSGKNFVEFIREQISAPRIVVLLLSQNYFDSQFCLCELGAAWVLSHRIVPLLVSPLQFGDVKAVLTGVHLLKIDDTDALNQMREDLVAELGVKGKSFARWEATRNKFIAWLKEQGAEPSRATMASAKQAGKHARQPISHAQQKPTQVEDSVRDQLERLTDWQRWFLLRFIVEGRTQIPEFQVGGYKAAWDFEMRMLINKGIVIEYRNAGVYEITTIYYDYLKQHWNPKTEELR